MPVIGGPGPPGPSLLGWVVVELLEPMVLPVAAIHEPETEAEPPHPTRRFEPQVWRQIGGLQVRGAGRC